MIFLFTRDQTYSGSEKYDFFSLFFFIYFRVLVCLEMRLFGSKSGEKKAEPRSSQGPSSQSSSDSMSSLPKPEDIPGPSGLPSPGIPSPDFAFKIPSPFFIDDSEIIRVYDFFS